jgi:hypothetical protein
MNLIQILSKPEAVRNVNRKKAFTGKGTTKISSLKLKTSIVL